VKSLTKKITCPLKGTRQEQEAGDHPSPPEAGRRGCPGGSQRGRSCPVALVLSSPLGSKFVNFHPSKTLHSRDHLPSGLLPAARVGGGVWRWRAQRTPSSPPSPGQTPSSFPSSPPSRLLAFPPLSPSTRRSCSRRRTLCSPGAGAVAARRLDRALHSLRSRSRALSPVATRCTAAQRQHRGGGLSLSPAPPSLPYSPSFSFPPSPLPHHVGVRILHPSRPAFPFSLFWKRERWREAARLQKERPACKVLL
jgi:hypothetical protein